jgi:hypothetical protein
MHEFDILNPVPQFLSVLQAAALITDSVDCTQDAKMQNMHHIPKNFRKSAIPY